MDNNFNSQSDNSSDWKSNSRQKNKSRTGSKSKLSVLTIVLLVTAIASIIANIVLLVTDSKRTADTVARIEDKDIETARNTEKDDMLNLIRSRFESGSSTLSLLKELYPDNIGTRISIKCNAEQKQADPLFLSKYSIIQY